MTVLVTAMDDENDVWYFVTDTLNDMTTHILAVFVLVSETHAMVTFKLISFLFNPKDTLSSW
jgi:hypothetical protein